MSTNLPWSLLVSASPFPPRDALTICFAHGAYQMADRFAARGTGIKHFQVRTLDELQTLLDAPWSEDEVARFNRKRDEQRETNQAHRRDRIAR